VSCSPIVRPETFCADLCVVLCCWLRYRYCWHYWLVVVDTGDRYTLSLLLLMNCSAIDDCSSLPWCLCCRCQLPSRWPDDLFMVHTVVELRLQRWLLHCYRCSVMVFDCDCCSVVVFLICYSITVRYSLFGIIHCRALYWWYCCCLLPVTVAVYRFFVIPRRTAVRITIAIFAETITVEELYLLELLFLRFTLCCWFYYICYLIDVDLEWVFPICSIVRLLFHCYYVCDDSIWKLRHVVVGLPCCLIVRLHRYSLLRTLFLIPDGWSTRCIPVHVVRCYGYGVHYHDLLLRLLFFVADYCSLFIVPARYGTVVRRWLRLSLITPLIVRAERCGMRLWLPLFDDLLQTCLWIQLITLITSVMGYIILIVVVTIMRTHPIRSSCWLRYDSPVLFVYRYSVHSLFAWWLFILLISFGTVRCYSGYLLVVLILLHCVRWLWIVVLFILIICFVAI